MQVHSVPAVPQQARCAVRTRVPSVPLHTEIIGYGASRPAAAGALRHRLLPCAAAVVVVDRDAGTAVLTGARAVGGTAGETTWGPAVSVAFTPAGVARLLGVPMAELHGLAVPLADVLGPQRTADLIAAGTADRPFALVDALFGRWRAAPRRATGPAPVVSAAWRRLQAADRIRVGAVAAELGVGRRRLERDLRRETGFSPGAVARIARFQRSAGALLRGATPADAAAAGGYADQPHLTRDTRALAGLTPGALRAILQDTGGRPA